MKRIISLAFIVTLLGGCASAPSGERVKRDRTRDCAPGMVQVCETRRNQPLSAGGDEEIPEYEYCHCERMIN